MGGALLVVPVDVPAYYGAKTVSHRRLLRILPDELEASVQLQPEPRFRGIYEVMTFAATLKLRASFDPSRLAQLAEDQGTGTIRWQEAKVLVPISSPRGIRELSRSDFAGFPVKLLPEPTNYLAGISAAVNATPADAQGPAVFELDLVLGGTGRFSFMPLAANVQVDLQSPWPHPSFDGGYAPQFREVTGGGFTARWSVPEITRAVPPNWFDEEISCDELGASDFGVRLLRPVDHYQRSYRAIHYAVLFIALTFGSLFLWEYTLGRRAGAPRLHAMHYLLVGIALAVFYLLLIALSEQLGFAIAYGLASLAMITLLAVYLAGVMRSRATGSVAAGGFATLYGALYLLVLSEDYALLTGALGLFAALALAMLTTRHLNWHAPGTS